MLIFEVSRHSLNSYNNKMAQYNPSIIHLALFCAILSLINLKFE